ncbi:tetratricopeptide repeat protein [Acidobacteriota bacterium]
MLNKKSFLVLFIVFGFTALAAGQLVEDYRFKGKVVDTKGNPIPTVQITFYNVDTGSRFSFTTKDDGTFDRRMIRHAAYDVTFEKTGYAPRKERFDWTAWNETVITKESDIILESDSVAAKRDLGKKVGKLYREAYEAMTKKEWETAHKKASAMIQAGAGDWEYAARFVVARSQLEQGQTDDAITEYKKVIELKPDLFEAHFDLAGLLATKGSFDEALAIYKKAVALNSDVAEVHYSIGAILFNRQQFTEAMPSLKKAVQLDSSHAQAHRALGYSYFQGETKDIDAGVEHLKKYLALMPEAEDGDRIRTIMKELGKM